MSVRGYRYWALSAVVALLHALTWLTCHWSMSWRAKLRFRSHARADLAQASWALITPAPNCGRAEIRPIVRHSNNTGTLEVVFQQIVLRFDAARGAFVPRAFPDALVLDQYVTRVRLPSVCSL